MRFMIIIKATKDSEAGVMPENELLTEMGTYHEQLMKAGVLLDGTGLQPSSKGWRINYDGNRKTIVDGSFAETKELIAGYTLIMTNNKEEAIEWSKCYPNPAGRERKTYIEVRQLFELDDFEPAKEIDTFKNIEKEIM